MCKSVDNKKSSCKSKLIIKEVLIVDEVSGKLVRRFNLNNYESKNKLYPIKLK